LRYGKALVDGFGVIKSGKKFSVELIEIIYRNIKKEMMAFAIFPSISEVIIEKFTRLHVAGM